MQITLNGEPLHTDASTIAALAESLNIDMRGTAIERNAEVVPRSLHNETALSEGDNVEIIEFMGGG